MECGYIEKFGNIGVYDYNLILFLSICIRYSMIVGGK